MTPTQQTQAESHLGSGAPMVSGAAVGEHGGICLDDLLFSARDSGRAQACEAGRLTISWTERKMAQESQPQGSPFGLDHPRPAGSSHTSATFPVPSGGQRGRTELACRE